MFAPRHAAALVATLVAAGHAFAAATPSLSPHFATARARRAPLLKALATVREAPAAERDEHRERVAAQLRRQLERASKAARKSLVAMRRAGRTPEADVVVIGGGVHGAVFAASLAEASPHMKVLTVEAGPTLGRVFAQAGPIFRINSPEKADKSTNVLPGAPVALRDLSSATFASADILGDVLLFTHGVSGAVPVLREKVTAITRAPGGADVALACGVTVRARAVVLATGLGKPRLPFRDEATRKLIAAEASRPARLGQAPDIEPFDSAMHRAAAAIRDGACPLRPYVGRRLGVVGAGDGGNVWVEFLLGHAPKPAYRTASVHRVQSQIVWAGQRSDDHAAFVAANKPRYHKVFEAIYASGQLVNVPEYLQSIRKVPGDQFVMRFASGREETVDKIVLCTGYANLATKLAAGLGDDVRFEPIEGRASTVEGPTLVARQALTSEGRAHPVYLVGAGAAPLASADELAASDTMNAVSINVLAPRTEGLARKLAAQLAR